MKVLLVDNYDSFTGNLAQLIARVTGELPRVVRNDAAPPEELLAWGPDRIVLSPGPGTPAVARDVGVCNELIQQTKVPLLGVCLGHQAIGYVFGGRVVHAPRPVHGYRSPIVHDGSGIFSGLPSPFQAVRYHSLVLDRARLPQELRVTAWCDDLVMGIAHRARPLYGVQFHPESIETEWGEKLFENFLGAPSRCRPLQFSKTLPTPPPSLKTVPTTPPDQFDFWIEREGLTYVGVGSERVTVRSWTELEQLLEGGDRFVGYLSYEFGCGGEARLLRIASIVELPTPPPQRDLPRPHGGSRPRFEMARSETRYRQDIARALEYIRDGESYELCLTTQVRATVDVDPLALFRLLRVRNPAPFASYLRLGDLAIVSASPERFVRIAADGRVESRPIKGTRRRGRTPLEDRRLRDELASSAKDRAENLMIVDLVRSDLGLVCKPDSVEVPARFVVEEHPTVFQLVSTVRGQLREGISPVEAVRTLFPGGSMTGAPKIRSMQILEQLEGEPRGVYAGGIGFFGIDGVIDLSMAIRTIVVRPGEISYGIGGAIVADSNPDAEIDEIYAKGQPLIDAVTELLSVE